MSEDLFSSRALTDQIETHTSATHHEVYPQSDIAALGVFLATCASNFEPAMVADLARRCVETLRPVPPDRSELHRSLLDCRRCPHATTKPTLPSGNVTDPAVLFVLEEPLAAARESPFLTTLAEAGCTAQNSVFTSLTRCGFADTTTVSEARPRCWSWLMAELDVWRPAVVVAVGAVVCHQLLSAQITRVHGLTHYIGAFRVFPLYSWPHAHSHESNQKAFTEDLRTLSALLRP